jgi:hypothetical protein
LSAQQPIAILRMSRRCGDILFVSVMEEHGQSAVARGGLELEIGGSFRGGIGAKSMTHIMRAAVGDICSLEGLLPTLLDVDSPD